MIDRNSQFNKNNNNHHNGSGKKPTKSEKVINLFNFQPETPNRPFRRKQQTNHQNYINGKKTKYEDVGKLISNTSFGDHTDLKRIVSASPVHCRSPKIQRKQIKIETPKSRQSLRENRSFTELQKVLSTKKSSDHKLLGSLENISSEKRQRKNQVNNNEELKQLNSQSQCLKLKIQSITLQKMQLLQKCQTYGRKIRELERDLLQKQNTINKLNLQLMQRSEQRQKQMQINKCMQQVISQLNVKIQQLLNCNRQSSFMQEIQYSVLSQKEYPNEQNKPNVKQLESEIQYLRQKVYALNRSIQSLQVQVLATKKFRYQIQREKGHVKILEKQNKSLKEKLLTIMKLNKVKSAKLSLKKQLQYSVSFQFQQ